MARDWIEIVKRVEALFPQARGGANYDDSLRSMLVPWANDIIYELGEMQRWSYEYVTSQFTTVSGDATYTLASFNPRMTVIRRVFYIDAAGQPQNIERRDRFEAARLLGDTSVVHTNPVANGAPREYSLDGNQIELFPPPDTAGFDSGGNYLIFVQGYQVTSPIVETTGTTNAASPTLTVPSSAYLTDQGLATTGTQLSVRSAGNLQFAGTPDTFVTGWSAFPTGTTVTMTGNAVTTQASPVQVFFNSQPWMVTWWPKVLLFGILREVASYLQNPTAYQLWEGRYQNELNLLRAYEFDRMRSVEMMAAATVGQNTPEDRRIDMPVAFDVRGII